MIRAALLAFTASTLVDLLMARWVTAVAEKRTLLAGLLSMGSACCVFAGIDQAFGHRHPVVVGAWILGYGVGTVLAIKLPGRKKKST